jgi:hypothetical protein
MLRPRCLPATLLLAFFASASASAGAQELRLPLKSGSLRFAAIGDTGTASREQYDIGKQMAAFRARFPFDFVIMLGDNIYGGDTAQDFKNKFELPYKPLLDGGVKFYASLGNHDNPTQRFYKLFNMDGQRFYTFKPKAGVRFFALDSNYMDKPQLDWLEKELAASASEWKICFFHHPLYSSARKHGSTMDLRGLLEPLFIKHKVDAVFNGHDHAYERVKPQHGVYYFVSGAGGSLRKGDLARAAFTEAGFDQDFQFMLIEIDGEDLYFQTVSRTGKTVDSGVIHRPPGTTITSPPSPLPASPAAPVVAAPVAPSPAASPSPAPPASPAPSPSAKPSPKPSPKPSAKRPAKRASPKPKPKPTPSPRP